MTCNYVKFIYFFLNTHFNEIQKCKFEFPLILKRSHFSENSQQGRLASFGILGKERGPGVGKLDWYGNFDTGCGRD